MCVVTSDPIAIHLQNKYILTPCAEQGPVWGGCGCRGSLGFPNSCDIAGLWIQALKLVLAQRNTPTQRCTDQRYSGLWWGAPLVYSRFSSSKEYPQSLPLPSPDTLCMWWEKRHAKKFKNLRHVSVLLQADEMRYRGWCNRCRRMGHHAKTQVRQVEVSWGQ